ncbi:probable LRR receptor-like serine/threonine-protein kinase At5g48740 [Cryptomeria japonica]|uniref:probable LRR receptor-like serine/threonine-protein kinase At5g48740 n=1 Tax=Cryptomeria japonica TaxID=3369 RepID=UPI0025ABA44C|nr:probable LRR receptor-like serine/threonine-protein kinase At5g48740 [Cryptomeria japonica]XP_059078138.1 probable LRR receptor-like serine/threonine-protein kinase At5g48740 [Cryptomeria japonica]
MIATENMSHKIGEGGFGSVYFGKLQNGKDVAVKLLSSLSKQGATEFLNEIDLLSRLNHRNLVSLLGYCNDFKQQMLVYEHMPCGSLKDHLHGSLANSSTLDWKTRLRVALDAAEGLEYLHVSCTPKIVHRDVKSSNILLDSRLRAKVADFGLSKMIGDDNTSHVTTTIKGSVGYLDPEYFRTSKLTEKSDVYSFGVVLLEIICGRKPIDAERSEEELSLIKWVLLYVAANEEPERQLTDILDKRMHLSKNDFKSFNDLLDLSIKCIQSEASKRPTISEIVTHLREALISVVSDDTTEENVQSFSFAEYSCSLIHAGR